MGIPSTIKKPPTEIDGRGVEKSYKPVIPVVFGRTCCITTGTPTTICRGNYRDAKHTKNLDGLRCPAPGL